MISGTGTMGEGGTTVKISQTAARYVRQDTPREERLQAAQGRIALPFQEIPLVLFFLSRDTDPEVRAAALAGLQNIAEDTLFSLCDDPEAHPKTLELLARMHCANAALLERIANNPGCDTLLLQFLAERGCRGAQVKIAAIAPAQSPLVQDPAEQSETPAEEEEEFLSKFQMAQEMGISEKIKIAMTGDKEWRMLLVKDTNKLVSGAVIKNPRITEAEILLLCKSALNNDDLLREICGNKEWTKNYQIKKALVENGKTPLPAALRFLGSLTEKDLAMLAKSKSVSSVISTQARRALLNKNKEK